MLSHLSWLLQHIMRVVNTAGYVTVLRDRKSEWAYRGCRYWIRRKFRNSL